MEEVAVPVPQVLTYEAGLETPSGSFEKLGGSYFWVLTKRIIAYWVLSSCPRFLGNSYLGSCVKSFSSRLLAADFCGATGGPRRAKTKSPRPQ